MYYEGVGVGLFEKRELIWIVAKELKQVPILENQKANGTQTDVI